MLRPGFPRLSHPEVAHAIPSVGFMAQVYRRVRLLVSPTIVGVQLTDQQRTAQAPKRRRWTVAGTSGSGSDGRDVVTGPGPPAALRAPAAPGPATTSISTASGMRIISPTLPAPTLISPGRLSHRLLAQGAFYYRWDTLSPDSRRVVASVLKSIATCCPASHFCNAGVFRESGEMYRWPIRFRIFRHQVSSMVPPRNLFRVSSRTCFMRSVGWMTGTRAAWRSACSLETWLRTGVTTERRRGARGSSMLLVFHVVGDTHRHWEVIAFRYL